MDCAVFMYIFVAFTTVLLTRNSVEGKNDPKIYTKDGSVHIRSGDNGNIVFEHPSPAGKVIVAGQELNVINSTGSKGEKGERGYPGLNGTLAAKGQTGDKGELGTKGDKGERGERGLPGTNGTTGTFSTKGDQGAPGPVGPAGRNGSDGQKGDRGEAGPPGGAGAPGPIGPPGLNGTDGDKGANGTQGLPGMKGEKGDMGDTPYLIGNESVQCNGSNFGVLRYFSARLQLCTPRGWRYLSFEPADDCSNVLDTVNMPQTNYKAFQNADLGIMFQFNRNYVPSVISRANLNITSDISPWNATLPYEEAVMRQAVQFTGGQKRINIFGIPDDFWRNSNWSVMALLKFRDIGQGFVRVLGHGTTNGHQGLHLGIVIATKTVIHGYYSNDFEYGKVEENTWYHITWTSMKTQQGEYRCININNAEHKCERNSKGVYQGSGVTTLGAWWHETLPDSLLLDNLIIASGIVQYNHETAGEKQECFARTLDKKLP